MFGVKIRENMRPDLSGRDRAAEEIALRLIAIDFVEKGRLCGRFNAFDGKLRLVNSSAKR